MSGSRRQSRLRLGSVQEGLSSVRTEQECGHQLSARAVGCAQSVDLTYSPSLPLCPRIVQWRDRGTSPKVTASAPIELPSVFTLME